MQVKFICPQTALGDTPDNLEEVDQIFAGISQNHQHYDGGAIHVHKLFYFFLKGTVFHLCLYIRLSDDRS